MDPRIADYIRQNRTRYTREAVTGLAPLAFLLICGGLCTATMLVLVSP